MFLFVIGNQTHLIVTVVGTVLSLIAATLLESKILQRLGWADISRCLGFAVSTNLVTPVFAFIYLVIVIVTLNLMKIGDLANIQENISIPILIAAIFLFAIVIFRRQMLVFLQIRRDVWSWVYAFISTKITFWMIAVTVFFLNQIFNK